MQQKSYIAVWIAVVIWFCSMPTELWAAPVQAYRTQWYEESRFDTCTLIVSTKESVSLDFSTVGATDKVFLGDGIYLLSYPDRKATKNAWKKLSEMDGILFAEPDGVIESEDAEAQNLPEKQKKPENQQIPEEQTEAGSEITSGETSAGEIKAAEGEPVLVAVIDTGVDGSDKTTAFYLKDTGEEFTDENGHGTRVAGLMARSLAAQGIDAGEVQILPIKTADENGRCTVAQLYLAIRSAIGSGADIINISMGTKSSSKLLEQAAYEAEEAGVFLVTSAGNDNTDVAGKAPADIESVITVGSVNRQKEKSAFSNYGAAIDCVAYGEGLVWKDGELLSGTSYAAALASAGLAGALAAGELGTVQETDTWLAANAEDLGIAGKDETYGYGLVAFYEPEWKSEEDTETDTEETEQEPQEEVTETDIDYLKKLDTYNLLIGDIQLLASNENLASTRLLADTMKTDVTALFENKTDIGAVLDGKAASDILYAKTYMKTGNAPVDAEAERLALYLKESVLDVTAYEGKAETFTGMLEQFVEFLAGYQEDIPLSEDVYVEASATKTVGDAATLQSIAQTKGDYTVKLTKNITTTSEILVTNGCTLRLQSDKKSTRRTVKFGTLSGKTANLSLFKVNGTGANKMYVGTTTGDYPVTLDGNNQKHNGFLIYNSIWSGNADAYKSVTHIYAGTILQNNVMYYESGCINGASGSGICNYGTLYLHGGTIRNNGFAGRDGAKVGEGAGIANYGKFQMSGGEITGNVATNGNGILTGKMGDVPALARIFETTITGGTIHDNGDGNNHKYTSNGGGILINPNTPATIGGSSIDKVKIYGNMADYGGGIANYGNCSLGKCRIYENYSESEGGGILNRARVNTAVVPVLNIDGAYVYQNYCSKTNSNYAGGIASLKRTVGKTDIVPTITVASGYFYDNDGFSIHIDSGTLSFGAGARFGFSSYSKLDSYTVSEAWSGGGGGSGVCNTGGTVTITGTARMCVPDEATGIRNTGTLSIADGADFVILCREGAACGIENTGTFTSGAIVKNSAGTVKYPYIIDGSADYGIKNTGSGKAFLRGLVRGNYIAGTTARTAKTGTALNLPGFDTGIYNTSAASYNSAYPYAVVCTGTDNGSEKYYGLVQYAATGIYNDTASGKVLLGQAKVLNCKKNTDAKKGYGVYNKATLAINDADAVISGCAMCGIYNTGTTAMTGGTVSANAEHGVYNTGSFTMDGAATAITGNGGAGAGSGAGIYNRKTVEMKNGSISGNKAGTYGGGLMNKAGADFTMTGGKINGNLCEQNITDTTKGLGGGIYNESGAADGSTAGGILNLYAGYIYGNNDYGIRNKGTLNVATQATPASGSRYVYMGVSSYTSSAAYTVSANTLGNICNYGNGTISIGRSGAVNTGAVLVTDGGTNIYTTNTLTVAGNEKEPFQTVLTGKGTGIDNAGGMVTLDSGLVIDGQTTGVNNVGTLLMKGSTISGCSENGITNSSKGKVTLTGGTISGNKTGIANAGVVYHTAGAVISKNTTHGVYQNGTFYMAGVAKVDTSNDVCLPVDHVITVSAKLTTDGVVAELTPLNAKDKPLEKITSPDDEVENGLGRKVVTTSYTGGAGSHALFTGAGKYRFVLTNKGILRPGDYMSTVVLAKENHSEINGVDIVISEAYDVTYEKNIEETDENGNPVDVAVKDFPATQSKYWCENLKLPNGTDRYTDPSVQTEPYSGYYVFNGWNGAADGSGTVYHMPETYRENAATTIYAQWMKKVKVAYIGNGQSEGTDFIDDGSDGSGVALNGDYTFDSNIDTATAEEHFTKEEEVEAFVDEETGEAVKQEVTSTVVGWTDDIEYEDVNYYKLGDTAPTAEVYENAAKSGNITIGAPNSDFGTYPKGETAEQASGELSLPTFLSKADSGAGNGLFTTVTGSQDFLLFDAPEDTTPYINMYAVWDRGPTIEAYDLYYTLEEAQETTDTTGITMSELLSRATAEDEEDGTLPAGEDIPYADGGKTSFIISDYAASDFTGFTTSGSVTINYRAIDTAGNITNQMVTVHIVDTTGIKEDKGRVRFISEKYIDTLDEDSIWVKNPEYSAKLQTVLANHKENVEHYRDTVLGEDIDIEKPGTGTWTTPPEEVWEFTHEEVLAVQQYVDDHGIGNSKEADGLKGFLTQFASCKQ